MPPYGLAWASLALSVLSALVILIHLLTGRRQKMAIMNWVWPITALYMGPVALWAYWSMGRDKEQSSAKKEHHQPPVLENRFRRFNPLWRRLHAGRFRRGVDRISNRFHSSGFSALVRLCRGFRSRLPARSGVPVLRDRADAEYFRPGWDLGSSESGYYFSRGVRGWDVRVDGPYA